MTSAGVQMNAYGVWVHASQLGAFPLFEVGMKPI